MTEVQSFSLNKIINETSKSLSNSLEPICKEVEANVSIINKLNEFVEELPIYKDILNKYNFVLNENNEIKEKLIVYEKYFNLLVNKHIKLYKINKKLVDKYNIENNYGYWYEKEYCHDNGSVYIKINDKQKRSINDINSIYSQYGIEKEDNKKSVIYERDEDVENEDVENEDVENEDVENEEEEEDEYDCQIDVFEMIINKKKYYVSEENNGTIYESLENDEVGNKVGIMKNGKPFFI
jgi:hypothetical protein